MRQIKINEADYSLIRANLVSFLNTDTASPFYGKNYSFSAGSMAVLLDAMCYVIHYSSWQLNKSISELFSDTVTLRKNLFALLKNFNYIPFLKTPARKYLKVRYNLDTRGSLPYVPVGSDSLFKLYFNTANYTSTTKLIPTIRDKWQQSYYTAIDNTEFVNKNLAYFFMTYYQITDRYLEVITPAYQAEWKVQEIAIDGSFTQLVDLIQNGVLLGDKVVMESIRVFVKSGGIWDEYKNLRKGVFDSSLKTFNLGYDYTKGLQIKFDIDNLSRELQTGETLRIFYAVTEGNDINEIQGTNEFNFRDFANIRLEEITADGTTVSHFSFDMTDGVNPESIYLEGDSSPSDAEVNSRFSAQLVDVDGNLTYFDNGTDIQSDDSIKESMSMFFSTQGRAVTENDYTSILRAKFSEFKDIRAWSGAKEFLDIENMAMVLISTYMTNIGGTTYSATQENILKLIYKVMLKRYTAGELGVIPDNGQLDTGQYIRDTGFIYLSLFDDKFQFVTVQNYLDEIVSHLDEYKILTMFFKFMTPNFILLKPEIKVRIKPAYSKDFKPLEMKYSIYNLVNMNSGFDKPFDIKSIYSNLIARPDVEFVDSFKYTAKIKALNNTLANQNEYMYIRAWTPFKKEINTTINSGLHVLSTDDGTVMIDGIVVEGVVNYQLGVLKFKNLNSTNYLSDPTLDCRFVTDTNFVLDSVQFTTDEINSVRETVVGIESPNDVIISFE